MVFLAEVYADFGYVPYPSRVALKVDAIAQGTFSCLDEEVASLISGWAATFRNETNGVICYSLAMCDVGAHIATGFNDVMKMNEFKAATLLTACSDEGGISLATLPEFLVGGYRDRHLHWRRVCGKFLKASTNPAIKTMVRQAYNRARARTIVPKDPTNIVRNPLSIRRKVEERGETIRSRIVTHAMDRTNHHPVWDNMKTSSDKWIEKIVDGLEAAGEAVDAISAKDIVDALPETELEAIRLRFYTSKAVSYFISVKEAGRGRIAIANADHKYLAWLVSEPNPFVAMESNGAWDDCALDRETANIALPVVNAVIPDAADAFTVYGTDGEIGKEGLVKFTANDLSIPGGRRRQDNRVAPSGRSQGFKTAKVTFEDIGR